MLLEAHLFFLILMSVMPHSLSNSCDSTCNKLVCLNYSSRSHLEPRGYSEMITHVGVDGLPDSSINCHRMLSSAQPVSVVGTLQKTERYRIQNVKSVVITEENSEESLSCDVYLEQIKADKN